MFYYKLILRQRPQLTRKCSQVCNELVVLGNVAEDGEMRERIQLAASLLRALPCQRLEDRLEVGLGSREKFEICCNRFRRFLIAVIQQCHARLPNAYYRYFNTKASHWHVIYNVTKSLN